MEIIGIIIMIAVAGYIVEKHVDKKFDSLHDRLYRLEQKINPPSFNPYRDD